ncbi:hypothetical protein CMQ_221 [Grosmannia clavigera kw1407]|uniref:Uncharacterized protein n=1 Tax=Grosmannia clavigera (strain kw1407 / UAMH 11150) TaxID=655863 RepID=F0XQN3_GROCL|nr:uncharacterized protein CMQ_221 [Grosmannia clavigera kw1407]EFW99903.1 hypothetical protein CMQ_221 [Grosmannia clavigera kw1407]
MAQAQAKSLFDLLEDAGTWDRSKYGKTITFCDTETQNHVRDMLGFYAREKGPNDLDKAREALAETRQHRRTSVTSLSTFNLMGLRSAAPAGIENMVEMEKISRDYWTRGTTDPIVDYLGMMNLLSATSKVLSDSPFASIHTEMMVPMGGSNENTVHNLLCGDLISVAALFRLAPVEFSTNSATNPREENLISGNPFPNQAARQEANAKSSFSAWKITWKRPPKHGFGIPSAPITFSDDDLASMLFSIYLNMFREESLKITLDRIILNRMAQPRYSRATFAAFLSVVRETTLVDWEATMARFLFLLAKDCTLMLAGNFSQEAIIHLHAFNVYIFPELKNSPDHRNQEVLSRNIPLQSWNAPPTAVYITMEIPRSCLEYFTQANRRDIPHVLQCAVQSPSRHWRHDFCALQVGFGKLTAFDERTDDTYELHVAHDRLGWDGNSPLIVSFMVPTWVLLQEHLDTCVMFYIRTTVATLDSAKHLGPDLNLFSTKLGDKRIHISRNPPNQSGPAIIHHDHHSGREKSTMGRENYLVSKSVFAKTNGKSKIESVTTRLEFSSNIRVSSLSTNGSDSIQSLSPWNMMLTLSTGEQVPLDLPVPVDQSSVQVLIPKDHNFVQVQGSVSTETSWTRSPSPVVLYNGTPVSWNTSHLNMDILPSIQTEKKLIWLQPHLESMFTGREKNLLAHKEEAAEGERGRIDLKQSLLILFSKFTEYRMSGKPLLFLLTAEEQGDVKFLVFPSKLRMDLSGRSVLLDIAVLPFYEAPNDKSSNVCFSNVDLLNETKDDMYEIRLSPNELLLWRMMLPSWIERCRTWKHRPTCEYRSAGRVPIQLLPDSESVCSCGRGHFPKNYFQGRPQWNSAAQFASRAAISPLFPSRLVGNAYHGSSSASASVLTRIVRKIKTIVR